MYDPKDVFTESGLVQHARHMTNMRMAIAFFRVNADDLSIGALDDTQLTMLDDFENMLEIYENGDGEQPET